MTSAAELPVFGPTVDDREARRRAVNERLTHNVEEQGRDNPRHGHFFDRAKQNRLAVWTTEKAFVLAAAAAAYEPVLSHHSAALTAGAVLGLDGLAKAGAKGYKRLTDRFSPGEKSLAEQAGSPQDSWPPGGPPGGPGGVEQVTEAEDIEPPSFAHHQGEARSASKSEDTDQTAPNLEDDLAPLGSKLPPQDRAEFGAILEENLVAAKPGQGREGIDGPGD